MESDHIKLRTLELTYAIIIVILIPLALRGVRYRPTTSARALVPARPTRC
jgi:high-affinity K+ transport system ATPase subunit B